MKRDWDNLEVQEELEVEVVEKTKKSKQKNDNDNHQKPKTKIGVQILLVTIIMLAVMAIVFSFGDFLSIIDVLSNMRVDYLVYTLIFALAGLITFTFAGFVPLLTLAPEIDKLNAFLINSTEPFFNGITPFGAGSQPFQIYYMIKEGVEGNKATSVTMANFVIYQTIISLLAVFSMIFYYPQIYASMGSSVILLFLGFTLNTLILLFFIVLTLSKRSYIVFENLIKWLSRFKFMKKRSEKWLESTTNFIVSFQSGFKFLMSKKRVFITSVLLKLIGLILQYSVVVILALSLGYSFNIDQTVYLVLISMLSFTVMMWIPLPGSSGGTEWIFTLLVLPLFGFNNNIVLSLLLLWRIITYYFAMLYGGIGYFILVRRGRKKAV